MSLVNDIRKGLVLVISKSDKVQVVKNYPATKFEGYPAVCVIFNGLSSEAASNVENERSVNFKIDILEQCGRDLENLDAINRAESHIADVVTDIIDRIEDTYNLDGADSIDFTLPANSDEPVFVETDAGYARKVSLFSTAHKRFIT